MYNGEAPISISNVTQEEKMNYFEQIEAMHQQVREYVEKMEPEYKVAEIEADFKTSYKPTLSNQDFTLTNVEAQFRVMAYSLSRVLTCKVYVIDGKFYLDDLAIHRYYKYAERRTP